MPRRIVDPMCEAPPCRAARSVSAQVLGQEEWVSSKGTSYSLLLLETPDAGEDLWLSDFRKKVKRFAPALDKESPRTQAIENDEHADHILRLWTPSGRISKQR